MSNTKELFGDSSSDEEDDNSNNNNNNNKAPEDPPQLQEPPATATTSTTTATTTPPPADSDDSDNGDDDNEFDDAGAVVGVSSGTVRPSTEQQQQPSSQQRSSPSPPLRQQHWVVPKAPKRPETTATATTTAATTVHMIKLPNLVNIQTQPFDVNTYDPDDEDEHFGGAVHNLMRWRYVKDDASSSGNNLKRTPDGSLMRESNTRLVQWEDGSWTMHVGKEVFGVESMITKTPSGFSGRNGYLYLSQTAEQVVKNKNANDGDANDDANKNTTTNEPVGTVLEGVSVIHSRFTVQPSGLQSEAHKALTLAVRQKTTQTAKIAPFMTQDDPEKRKLEKIKLQTELQKIQDRKRNASGSGNYTASRSRPRMSKDYLEGDEEDYDTINIRAMKKGAREGYNDEDNDDDDDEEMDFGDDSDDDDSDDDEIFNRQKTTTKTTAAATVTSKPGAAATGASDSDDDGFDDDGDDDEEQAVVKKPTTVKRSNMAVLDDDSDSE